MIKNYILPTFLSLTFAGPIVGELIHRETNNGKAMNLTTIVYDINNDGKADLTQERCAGAIRFPVSFTRNPTQSEIKWYNLNKHKKYFK